MSLTPEQIAVVVTTAFFPNSAQSILNALQAILQLPIRRVLLLHDRKSAASTEKAREAFDAMRSKFEEAKMELMLWLVDAYETANRWREGLVELFKDPAVQAVFVFPGDMGEPPSPDQVKNWKRLLDKADSHKLVIGDYQSTIPIKILFDPLIAWPTIRLLFPHESKTLMQFGLTKMRSEFFVIGRSAYEQFEKQLAFSWSADPTVPIILSCLQNSSIRIENERLGRFDDVGGHGPFTQMHQILRFSMQLALDRIGVERARRLDPAAERRAYDDMIVLLKKLFKKTIEALKERLF